VTERQKIIPIKYKNKERADRSMKKGVLSSNVLANSIVKENRIGASKIIKESRNESFTRDVNGSIMPKKTSFCPYKACINIIISREKNRKNINRKGNMHP
jgi:hypothetical protein